MQIPRLLGLETLGWIDIARVIHHPGQIHESLVCDEKGLLIRFPWALLHSVHLLSTRNAAFRGLGRFLNSFLRSVPLDEVLQLTLQDRHGPHPL